MKKLKKVIPIIIAFIIGISTTVCAATVFNSKDITYSNSATTKKNVKDSLDELYTKASKIGHCPKGQYCYDTPKFLGMAAEVGDYISMTPTSTSYTISKDVTGYSKDVVIHPNKLNLWRVIKINDDYSMDAVSVYVENVMIYISSFDGCKNFMNILETTAAQFINSNYTLAARPMNLGDENLVQAVFGSTITSASAGGSQLYSWRYNADISSSSCVIKKDTGYGYNTYTYNKSSSSYPSTGSTIRPVVKLKAKIRVTGNGKSVSDPYKVL